MKTFLISLLAASPGVFYRSCIPALLSFRFFHFFSLLFHFHINHRHITDAFSSFAFALISSSFSLINSWFFCSRPSWRVINLSRSVSSDAFSSSSVFFSSSNSPILLVRLFFSIMSPSPPSRSLTPPAALSEVLLPSRQLSGLVILLQTAVL